LSDLISHSLNNSGQLFYLVVDNNGLLLDANVLFKSSFHKSLSGLHIENDIFLPTTEEKKELDGTLQNAINDPGNGYSLVLRHTALFTGYKPVRWECMYDLNTVDGSAFFRWMGFPLYDKEEEDEERRRLELKLLRQEWDRKKMLAQAAVDAQEKERADIGKELHDNISQMLTSTKLFLDILKTKTDDELVDRSIKNINSIIQEVRSLSRSLVPSSIADLGLIASMHDLFENIRAASVIELEFYPDEEIDRLLSPNSKLTLYRIVQEQINNIIKHAGAKQVFVELFSDEGNIELIIGDDGVGFDPETIKKGMGLQNMRSRAELLSGSINIISAPGKGSKIKVVLPINQ
jgi:signal transduction histidine kinase